MAKKVTGSVKLQIAAGKATPAPPVGPALGQAQINIMEFCKQFNARTNQKEMEGLIIPVVVSVYSDRSFTFITKSPPASILLLRAAGVEKGSPTPNKSKVGKVTRAAIPADIRAHCVGPRLTSTLSYFVGQQGVSKRGVAEIAEVIFDAKVSLGTVAALGVFNTIVLNTRERRRDLGMLKSIGMTPRQVIAMLLTSMGVLGVLGGLIGVPLGVEAHRLVVPAMVHSGQLVVPDFLLHVFDARLLSVLGLAAVAVALLGALIPSRSAAWRPIAEVLHNE